MSSKRAFIFILLLLISIFFVIYETWPIVQSEEKIRSNMLSKFPVGTSKEIIWEYVQPFNKGRANAISQREIGWRKDYINDPLVGVSRIRAMVYDFPPISVSVIWMFDKEDNLIEVAVLKTIDLL